MLVRYDFGSHYIAAYYFTHWLLGIISIDESDCREIDTFAVSSIGAWQLTMAASRALYCLGDIMPARQNGRPSNQPLSWRKSSVTKSWAYSTASACLYPYYSKTMTSSTIASQIAFVYRSIEFVSAFIRLIFLRHVLPFDDDTVLTQFAHATWCTRQITWMISTSI